MRQIPKSSPFALLLLLLAASGVMGQPSGGPYGPLLQHYPLPEAETLFFVAPDGDPDADGRSTENPTTLERAIVQASTGDAVILRGGLYRTGGIHFNQGITFQPYADEQPVLTGTLPATEWESLPDGRWRTSWDRLFPAAPADWWRAERHREETPLHRFNNDMVFVDGRPLLSAGSLEDVRENTYYIDYARGLVHIGVDPNGREIEITAHNNALVRTIRRVHGKDNDRQGPTIRGITFTRYARLALLVEGVEPGRPMDPSEFGKEVVGTTLEHLTISHCSRVAGYFRGDGLTIRHCRIADCGTEGLYVINSSDVLLERNIVTRTNAHEQFAGYYASAIKIFNQSYDVVVRDNVIIDNPDASGIWYDVGNVDGVIINNWVERTNDGFFFEISKGALCAGNVFFECTPGIRILNSADVAVYQNTFYNSALEIGRSERSAEAGDHFGWHASAGPAVEARDGHVAHNNLFVADELLPRGLVQLWQSPAAAEIARDQQLGALDGNAYAAPNNDQPLVTWNEHPFEPPAEVVTSLAALQAEQPAFEAHGAAFSGSRGPVVRSAHLKRLELLSTFPGASTAVPLPDAVREALDWPESSGFPGAYPPVEP